MNAPSKNTFVHFNLKEDSDSEDEVTMRKCRGAPPICCAHLEHIRTMDTMLASSSALPDLSIGNSSGHIEGLIYIKNTFLDYDSCQDPDFELPQRRRCRSEPMPSKALIEESSVVWLYGATLRARAARLLTNITQRTFLECEGCASPHTCQNGGSGVDGVMPAELGRCMSDTLGSFSSSVAEYEHPNVAENQANPRPPQLPRVVTKLMVCNLPCKLTEEGLAHAVDSLGFAGLYDNVYIPRGSKNGMGYGFVNFRTAGVAASFAVAAPTYIFRNSEKRSYCKPATRQD